MPQLSPSKRLEKLDRQRLRNLSIGLAALGAATWLYWQHLQASHEDLLAQTTEQTEQLAVQAAHGLALQVTTHLRKIDAHLHLLADLRNSGSVESFEAVAASLLRSIPEHAPVLIQLVDDGEARFERRAALAEPTPQPGRFNLNRPTTHEDSFEALGFVETETGLLISRPTLDPVTGQWVVQFIRRLNPESTQDGYVALWIAASHLADAMRDVFPGMSDVAALVRNDGVYLARSGHQEDVMGFSVPATRPYVVHLDQEHGNYEARAEVDDTERFYGWHRTHYYPLAVLVGMDRERALAITREAIKESRRQNLAGIGLLWLTALIVAALWWQRAGRVRAMHDITEQLTLAIDGGSVAIWDFDLIDQRLKVSDRWQRLYDLAEADGLCSANTRLQRIHPDDLPIVKKAWDAHLRGAASQYHAEFRLVLPDGTTRYVAERGRVIEHDKHRHPSHLAGTSVDITHRKQTDLARQAAQALLQNLVAQIPGAVYQFQTNPDGTSSFPYASPGIKEIYGVCAERLMHSADAAFAAIEPADLPRVQQTIQESQEQLTPWRCEYRVQLPSGETRWLSGASNPERLDTGATLWHGYIHDITLHRQATEALRLERFRLRALLEQFPEGILMADEERRVVLVNSLFSERLGLRWPTDQLEQLEGQNVLELPDVKPWSDLLEAGGAPPSGSPISTTTLAHGNQFLEITATTIYQEQRPMGTVWLVRDVTDQKRHEQSLHSLANTDNLTRLPNRRAFLHHLQKSRSLAENASNDVLIMLDIDHFKRVNDTWGHNAGDLVLQQLAGVMESALRDGDVAGRLGGEEFGILLHQIDMESARAVAERLRVAVEQTAMPVGNEVLHITISLGLTAVTPDEPSDILSRADEALYRAKNAGRNQVHCWQGVGASA